LDYFRYLQATGQSFADYVAKLRQKGNEADLADLSVDELYVFRILSGISDMKLKEKLLELKSPSLAALVAEATDFEVARRNLKACGNEAAARVSRQEERQGGAGRARSKSRAPYVGPKCPECGNREHEGDRPCPAASWACHNCGKKGHFSKARNGAQICPERQKDSKDDRKDDCRDDRRDDRRGDRRDDRRDDRRARSKAKKSAARRVSPSSSSSSDSEAGAASVRTVQARVARARLPYSAGKAVVGGNAPTPKVEVYFTMEHLNRGFAFEATIDTGAMRSIF
jgi:hypothetical protein